MKKSYLIQSFLLVFLTTALTGCDLIAGIFEAGVWVGVIIVVVVVVLLVWLLRKVLS